MALIFDDTKPGYSCHAILIYHEDHHLTIHLIVSFKESVSLLKVFISPFSANSPAQPLIIVLSFTSHLNPFMLTPSSSGVVQCQRAASRRGASTPARWRGADPLQGVGSKGVPEALGQISGPLEFLLSVCGEKSSGN